MVSKYLLLVPLNVDHLARILISKQRKLIIQTHFDNLLLDFPFQSLSGHVTRLRLLMLPRLEETTDIRAN